MSMEKRTIPCDLCGEETLPSAAGKHTESNICWPCINRYTTKKHRLAVWIRHLLVQMEEEFNVRTVATSKEDR